MKRSSDDQIVGFDHIRLHFLYVLFCAVLIVWACLHLSLLNKYWILAPKFEYKLVNCEFKVQVLFKGKWMENCVDVIKDIQCCNGHSKKTLDTILEVITVLV